MKTIQKYKISILIAFLGVFIALFSVLMLTPRESMVCLTGGGIISLIGGGLIIHYMNKYSEELAQKNTDKIDEFVKERTQTKIPPPPWMKEDKK